jgi:tRNA pseudouridine65 synthase
MSGVAPLPIVHADTDLVVVHKPAGLLVHRSALDAHEQDTALDRLRAQLGPAAGDALAPAHRLDKGTSGLLVFTLHTQAARALGAAFEQGRVHKRYVALVRGWPPEHSQNDQPLAKDPELPSTGQPMLSASTRFARLGRVEWPFSVDGRHPGSRYALVQAWPQTGRRHQIRRHLKQLSHPIVGDSTHGKGQHNRAVAQWLGQQRLWLHAAELRLPHPAGGELLLQAAPGPDWQALLARGDWLDAPQL